jgi:anti-sigma-K factor RskA
MWFAAAASIALILSAVTIFRATQDRDRLVAEVEVLRGLAEDDARALDSLSALVLDDRRLIEALTGPQVRIVELTSAGTRAPGARMFWDRLTNRWTMFAHALPAPPAGRTYQLWLLTTGDAPISAGTFAPDSAGRAVVRAEYPLPANALRGVAVTEEPAGGVPQPTGAMVLVGNTDR